ncbi:MAG: DNA polymerase/3'-5' exonuclease PolX [Patescibacteria group bacterium]
MKKKHYSNEEIIDVLRETLAAMEVKEVNRFRIRAYQNAIDAIENLTSSVYDLWEKGTLSTVNGIGATLSQHLNELFTTGSVKDFTNIKKDLPDGMFGLLVLRGVGAKTAYKLANAFDINKRENALDTVKKAAQANKIQLLPGFGEKSEKDILNAIEEAKEHKSVRQRLLLPHAEEISQRVITHLKKSDAIVKIDVLGSQRRREDTVGDLDLAVITTNPEEAILHFLEFPEIKEVDSKGEKKASVILTNGVQVDLRVSTEAAYGAMLQYFTGNKQHNVLLRSLALEQKKSLSEYGIKINGNIKEFPDEESFYTELGLPYIPPELRQGDEEIEFAQKNKLPNLVNLSDIKGDLHTHTTYSDGTAQLPEMVEKAIALGYKYIGITDHAPSVQSRGRYDVLGIIEARKREIEQINSSQSSIRVLFGYEINILKDASISLPEDIVAQLDYAIGAIHTSMDQSKDEITKRLVAALEHPHINIIAHPSGRLLNQRNSYEVDWDVVLDAAKANKKILEIDAQPSRRDLAYDLVKRARKMDIKLSIDTDAHSVLDMELMPYGIDVARRGWCEAKDIINTYDLDSFLKLLG